jgi:DNA-binding GntR family transcriptional regulator
MPLVRRSTLTDDVYTSLQTLVMDHAIAPGDRLNIDALARRLQVSPTPVREALARLEADGLVRKRPLAGYTATPLLTRQEFEELFDIRLVLETATARRAAAAGLDAAAVARLADEAHLPDLVPEARGYAGYAAFTRQDARFHHLLAELSGNRMLHDAVVRLRFHLHLFRLDFPASHQGISTDEHVRVVRAIAERDPGAAESAMRAHVCAARERHLPFFSQVSSQTSSQGGD